MAKIYYSFANLLNLVDFFTRGWWIAITCRDPIRRRQRNIANTHRMSRKFCRSLQIAVTLKNPERLSELKDQAYLMVSNHISYTDILVLASIEKLVFITSVEMRNSPFLGAVTRLGGSLYTNRKSPVSLKQEIQNFSDAIDQGFKVVLFPEGTSSEGRNVKDFKRSLFQIARNSDCRILPVSIRYTTINGRPFDDSNRDLVAWYGDMSFAPHFLKLLGLKIEVEVEILESIVQTATKTRTGLSEAVYRQISNSYHKVQNSI